VEVEVVVVLVEVWVKLFNLFLMIDYF